MGEPGLTQDITAYTNTKALRADTTNCARPSKLNQGSNGQGAAPLDSNHNSATCTSLINQAPTKLDRSQADQAGIALRKGNTSQSVSANTKRPTGWLNEMRCLCIHKRSKQVPATKPATTSNTMLIIWNHIVFLLLVG
jgi:hypothetical protein